MSIGSEIGRSRETKDAAKDADAFQKEALRKEIVNGEAVPRSIKLRRLMVKKSAKAA